MTTIRTHAGHGRGNGHGHDNAYLVSKNSADPGVRITRIGLLVNLAMAIGKGFGGVVFHSQALVADAFHALTDMVSDLMTLATVSWSLKTPTDRFPAGYGKIESLGALGVSGLLLFGGIGMGLSALDTLYLQLFTDAAAAVHEHDDHAGGLFGFLGHSHSHGGAPDLNAAWLAAGSVLVKEWLYRTTMKIAKERKSAVLASNAIHHRIDSLTSIVALCTIGGAHVFTDASWLDPVGGLIISIMVIRGGWSNTLSSLLELADVTVDPEVNKSVDRAARKAIHGDAKNGVAGVTGADEVAIKDIQGVKSGQNYLMDIELAVPSSWTVEQTRVVEEAVRERIGAKVRGARRIRIRFTPHEKPESDFKDEFIPGDVSPRSSPEPESEDEHHHQNGHGPSHANGSAKKQK